MPFSHGRNDETPDDGRRNGDDHDQHRKDEFRVFHGLTCVRNVTCCRTQWRVGLETWVD